MDEKKDNKCDIDEASEKNGIKKVRKLIDKNRAAALGLAVLITLSAGLTGCSNVPEEDDDEDEDDSYYSGGHSYFYSSGGSYRHGSWSKSGISAGSGGFSGGYSHSRGGSVGG